VILHELSLQATTKDMDSSCLLITAVSKGFVVKNGNADGNCFCRFVFWVAEFFSISYLTG